MDSYYRWRGSIAVSTQSLGWPRDLMFDNEGRAISGVPQRVKDATAELAKVASVDGSLMSPLDRGGQTRREKVGPLEVEYESGAPGERPYSYVQHMLVGLGRLRGGSILKLGRV